MLRRLGRASRRPGLGRPRQSDPSWAPASIGRGIAFWTSVPDRLPHPPRVGQLVPVLAGAQERPQPTALGQRPDLRDRLVGRACLGRIDLLVLGRVDVLGGVVREHQLPPSPTARSQSQRYECFPSEITPHEQVDLGVGDCGHGSIRPIDPSSHLVGTGTFEDGNEECVEGRRENKRRENKNNDTRTAQRTPTAQSWMVEPKDQGSTQKSAEITGGRYGGAHAQPRAAPALRLPLLQCQALTTSGAGAYGAASTAPVGPTTLLVRLVFLHRGCRRVGAAVRACLARGSL
jgi:hypothetical protein